MGYCISWEQKVRLGKMRTGILRFSRHFTSVELQQGSCLSEAIQLCNSIHVHCPWFNGWTILHLRSCLHNKHTAICNTSLNVLGAAQSLFYGCSSFCNAWQQILLKVLVLQDPASISSYTDYQESKRVRWLKNRLSAFLWTGLWLSWHLCTPTIIFISKLSYIHVEFGWLCCHGSAALHCTVSLCNLYVLTLSENAWILTGGIHLSWP